MKVSRRTFIGGALAWAPLACRTERNAEAPSQSRGDAGAPALPPAVTDSVAALRSSSGDLSAQSLARGAALDGRLRSVIEWEREPAAGSQGPLRGIPYVAKDNIDTTGLDTTAGSLALLDVRPSRDADVITRLRSAGAVLVGKANMSEWANFRSTRSQSGWSARGGQCVSPWGLSRCPCGSSSGSAVAVAAGYVPFALGTETDGSILCPASQNGVVGIKPTAGLVSNAGVIPLSARQDVVGPMATSVELAAAVLEVLAQGQPRYPLDAASLGGSKLGIARGISSSPFHPGASRLFAQAIVDVRGAGSEVVERDLSWATAPGIGGAELTALLYEFHRDIGAYLTARGGEQRTLSDLIAFNRAHPDQELGAFGQELFERAEQTASVDDAAYQEALARCESVGPNLERALEGLDALIAPTTGPSWVLDPVYGDHFSGGSSTAPAAIAGFPTVTVPMGRVDGLPVGVSFIGRRNDEGRLLRLAYAYEQATGHGRQAPLD